MVYRPHLREKKSANSRKVTAARALQSRYRTNIPPGHGFQRMSHIFTVLERAFFVLRQCQVAFFGNRPAKFSRGIEHAEFRKKVSV